MLFKAGVTREVRVVLRTSSMGMYEDDREFDSLMVATTTDSLNLFHGSSIWTEVHSAKTEKLLSIDVPMCMVKKIIVYADVVDPTNRFGLGQSIILDSFKIKLRKSITVS